MSKTIAAVATGNSVSGIGVIRISGDNAIEIAEKVFKAMDSTPLSSFATVLTSCQIFSSSSSDFLTINTSGKRAIVDAPKSSFKS